MIFVYRKESLYLPYTIKYRTIQTFEKKQNLNFMTKKHTFFITLALMYLGVNFSCNAQPNSSTVEKTVEISETPIRTGADRSELYLPLLKEKKVGILTNQSGNVFITTKSVISNDSIACKLTIEQKSQSLVDFLLEKGVSVQKVYAPEHGFRGIADAGELIKDGKDTKTGLPIISLYGNNKKPTEKHLENIDVMLFDLQDVGVRFYTYISSLHYLMEACAEQNIPVIVLDRPNPIGSKIDGPILDMNYKSFVGMHPIPVLHGMTIGEYAQMINGEKWLKNSIQCDLTVIPCENYTKNKKYSLPVKPSPNLPNDQSIQLYASLCFFEGTNVSVGRGTSTQFQVYGSPFLKNMPYKFTPQPNEGAKSPIHQGKVCYGEDLTQYDKQPGLDLQWVIKAYKHTSDKKVFFNKFFNTLAGSGVLRKQIEQNLSEKEIKKSWEKGLEDFEKTRKKYLIYEE